MQGKGATSKAKNNVEVLPRHYVLGVNGEADLWINFFSKS